ncbi:MAG: tetratricopeptide repeat protein [Prolixibacteraceae bacterium]
MKRFFILTIFLILCVWTSQAQNERKFVRNGNTYYEAAMKDTTRLDTVQFNKAEIEYRKALDKKPDDQKWNFNLADALYKQKKFEESADKFRDIADHTTDKIEKSRALHNMGNSLLMNNKLDESIAAYKEALRNNPEDLETKYNLLYAMNQKKKQQEQQKKDQDKDKDKDKNKDQNKDQKKDEKKDQDQQNKDQQNKNQDQQKQQQQQNKISKQNAEQMLQALENNEKKIQDKVKKVQALKAQSKKVEKDW